MELQSEFNKIGTQVGDSSPWTRTRVPVSAFQRHYGSKFAYHDLVPYEAPWVKIGWPFETLYSTFVDLISRSRTTFYIFQITIPLSWLHLIWGAVDLKSLHQSIVHSVKCILYIWILLTRSIYLALFLRLSTSMIPGHYLQNVNVRHTIKRPLTQSQRRCMQLSWFYFCGICLSWRCGRTPLFRLQPSVNLHAQLQPLCSAALVPNVLSRRDEGSGELCAMIEALSRTDGSQSYILIQPY